MAKRKQSGGYASKRAAEVAAARRAEHTKKMIIWAGVVTLIVVAFYTLYYIVLVPILEREPEPVAATLLEGERPLAALDPIGRTSFYSDPPQMIINTDNEYEAIIRTSRGDLTLTLFDDEAPLTVNNFVFLAQEGFYDNTTFHRVLEGFMAQAGDPEGTGRGGPGYQFADEIDPNITFDRRGLLAMANAGPGTNGSQFFITLAPTEWLNGNHTIFGELTAGDDVLSAIRLRDPAVDPEPGDLIERIDIIEK